MWIWMSCWMRQLRNKEKERRKQDLLSALPVLYR